ncbi:hypothetical protein M758_3G217100 [Ceratodon purpureus]|uniref:DNA-directed RNA polymerase subunit n=1 Tax=Ceratodon purpureus TaxID=3225 RepID=A0A8T0INE2_CERPU|nr:hypothetical protein KC19_3G216200 [Ceratodon purpureus]KAG0624003.1 hypothetical protein M758_3G217100 [Ceratodon purpureus]
MAGVKEQQDCLFCNLCGSLLDFDSASFASCLLCHNQRAVQDFQGKEIWYTSKPSDFMRRLGVDLLIQPEEDVPETKETDQIQQRAVVNDECPKCKNPSLEYYTKQLRSADEGQTVFYECPKCHHKFSQNM